MSNLNFLAGQDITNLVAIPVGNDGTIAISNNSTGTSHVIVDIAGCFIDD